MSWPEAFSNVGIAMAVALVVYSICRWGEFAEKRSRHTHESGSLIYIAYESASKRGGGRFILILELCGEKFIRNRFHNFVRHDKYLR